mgnify:CR=1 FL=1
MGYRLASSKLQAGQNLFTVGFISIYESFKDMAVNYVQLRKFMLFTAFTNPAFNAAPGLAVTIMTAMGLTSNQVSLAIVLVVLVAILGPLLVTFLQRKYKVSIQKLMLGVVTFYMISIILFPLIASISYPFVIIAALSIGLAQGMWLASGQAFFASLCPGGKEATFTGAYMFANKLMDLNSYFSASGIITFKNSTELQNTFKQIPFNRLLIETDSPYLAPIPMRGKKNEPSFIKFTAEKLASIKDIDFDQIEKLTTNNFNSLFHSNVS